jgi:DNA invertase Pin-like site-specific DNA recombinase
VTDLSRIARDLLLMYEFAKMLAEYDVELIAVTDGEKVDISQLEIFTDVMRFYAKIRKGAKK